ncbi:MAG: GGDEF domain-containing protein [Gammaproteobacteria bacterium]|nr:GGDEF domain-containing protein [Gammaproteobacteria bacterium]
MSSPFFYITFSLMISSAALSVMFFIAWSNFGRRPHALSWSIAFFAGMLQWAVTLNSDLFPSTAAYLLTENVFALVLITFGLRGHCQRTECGWLPRSLFPYSAGVYVLVAWHIVVEPHAGLRLGIIPAFAALTLFMSSWMIISYRERTRPSEWAAAVFIAVFAATQAISAWMAVAQGAEHNAELYNAYMHFTFLTLPSGYMAMSMFIILMMASDISAKMKRLAVRDQLTGLLNRRGFNEYGEKAFSAARRNGTPLSVIMTDIDRFKYINDRYGHAVGDTALEHFAELVAEGRRREDVVARVGGEEFALLLPGTELRDAMALADQLCKKVGSTPMDLTSIGLPMTSSFGVAGISAQDTALDDMVRRADRALYRSKRAGRNQVDLESSQLMLAADGTLQHVSSG